MFKLSLEFSLNLSFETPKMRPILNFLIFLISFFFGGGGGRQKGILHIIKKSDGTALAATVKGFDWFLVEIVALGESEWDQQFHRRTPKTLSTSLLICCICIWLIWWNLEPLGSWTEALTICAT